MPISNFIRSHIKRSNQRLLFANLGLLAVVSFLMANPILPFPFSLSTDLLGLLALWNIGTSLWRLSSPHKHPIIKKIASYGDVDILSAEIENEILAGSRSFYDAMLTKSWYLKPKLFGLDLLKLADVVWSYEKVKKTVSNGVHSQTDCFVILKTRGGESYEVPMNGDQTADFLKHVAAAAPASLTGFLPELDELWHKDRALFLNKVTRA